MGVSWPDTVRAEATGPYCFWLFRPVLLGVHMLLACTHLISCSVASTFVCDSARQQCRPAHAIAHCELAVGLHKAQN